MPKSLDQTMKQLDNAARTPTRPATTGSVMPRKKQAVGPTAQNKPASRTTPAPASQAVQTPTSQPTTTGSVMPRNKRAVGPTAQNKPTQTVTPLRGIAKTIGQAFVANAGNASQISLPTVTAGQQNTATQQAARPEAQQAANNPVVRKKGTDNIVKPVSSSTSALRQQVTVESLSQMDLPDMYNSLSEQLGGSTPFAYSTSMRKAALDLNTQYAQTVMPAYDAYKQAEQAYLDGTGSWEDYIDKRNSYVSAYSIYQPQQEAWESIRRWDNQTYWRTAELTDVESSLQLFDAAFEYGQKRIEDMETRMTELMSSYNTADQTLQGSFAALQGADTAYSAGRISAEEYRAAYASYETAWNDYLSIGESISELQGQYSAQAMYLSEIASIGNYGMETYRTRYLEAHPEIAWVSGAGLEYNENNELVRNDTNFMDLIGRIDELSADNEDGHNNAEIATYYNILNSGLAWANMTQEDLGTARDYFESRIATAQEELDSLAWLDDADAAFKLNVAYIPPEGRDYATDRARRQQLQSQVNQSQYWINQLNTREYELAYDPVIAGLSTKTQSLVDQFILATADPQQAAEEFYRDIVDLDEGGTGARYRAFLVNDIPGGINFAQPYAGAGKNDAADLRSQLLEALRGEDLTQDQINGIMRYAQYEANAVRADRMAQDITASSAEASTFANYLNQLFLSLGSGTGAVENAVSGAWKLLNSDGSYKYNAVDPYLGKVAPIDYNSFGNLSTIAARAIGQGEFQRITNLIVDDPENPDAGQQRFAQFAYNMYNLAESMGQSVLIGAMGGVGMKNALLLLSGNAASNTMQDLHERGFSDASVIVGGLVSGYAEYVTEAVSLENLLSVFKRGALTGLTAAQLGKALGLNVSLQTLAESSEEGASDLVNLMYDQTLGQLLNGGLTQIEYNAVRAQQADPGLSWEDAVEGAWKDWGKELGQDMLYGALSGGIMGAGGYAGGYIDGSINAANTGRQINQAGGNNRFQLQAEAQRLAETIGGQASRMNAAQGTDTNLSAGRTLRGVLNAKGMNAIAQRLTELGEENITPDLVRAVNAAAAGDHLLPAERAALTQSQNGQQVINELQAYEASMQTAQENQTAPDLEGVEQWTLDRAMEQEATLRQYTETATGSNYIAQRANEQQLRYEAARKANPEADILTPISEQMTREGATPEVAARQGKILDKVFSGTIITNKEMRALDLNNPAVRKVFIDRSGLTGIPSGTMNENLKRTYVNQVTRENALIKERQADLAEGTDRLMEAKQVIQAERVAALQGAEEKTKQQNPFARILGTVTGGNVRARNAANRRVEAINRAEMRSAESYAGRLTEQEAVDLIKRQTGKDVVTRTQYLATAAQAQGVANVADLSAQQRAAMEQQYSDYINSLGLSAEAVRALQNASPGQARTAQVGEVVFDGSVDQSRLYDADGELRVNDPNPEIARRAASVKVLQRLAKTLGLRIYLYETNSQQRVLTDEGVITSDNGWFDPRDMSVHLDINAGQNGRGVVLFTAAHELTHLIKRASPERFETLKQFLFEKYVEHYDQATLDRLVNQQIDKIKDRGGDKGLTEEQLREKAEEEVVADSCERMLASDDVLSTLEDMRSTDKTLWEQFVDFLRDLFEKITGMYADMDPETEEGRLVSEMVDAFDEIKYLWTEGLSEATQRLSEMAPKDLDGDPGPVQYSVRSMVQGSDLTYRASDGAVLDKNGREVKHVTADMMKSTPLGRLVQDGISAGTISTTDADVQYKFLAELMNQIIETRDAALIWELAGTQAFSAIRSNSDTQYGKTIDFSTICKKTQQMVDVMSGAMMELGHGLNRQQVEMAYREVIKAGEPVPCPVCYVFSRWIGIGGILDDMRVFQNQYADMSEAELRSFMLDVEQQARDFAESKIKKAKNPGKTRAKFFADDGSFKLGYAMSEMKAPVNNRIRTRQNKINKSLDNMLQIEALQAEAEEAEKLGVPFAFAAQNEAAIKNLRKAVLSEEQLQKLEAEIASLQEQLRPVEAYQYLNGTIMLQTDEGEWYKNTKFKPVPNDVLFNLNAGSEFATEYPYSWKYRTTRGCNAGKAMLPYSDARVGETIQGIRYANVNDIYTNAEDNPFLNGNEKDRQDDLVAARIKQRRQNLIGGQRYQSTSDFRFEYGSDYLITFLEMQAIGANVQLYTKVIEAVDFLATMGADINLSVMPLGNGYIENADGTRTLVFSPVTGINGDAAIAKSRQYDNVQLILVGISDEHIRTALAGTDVTFVIPFHGSGNTTTNIQTLMNALDEDLDVTKAKDYTAVQGDHEMANRTAEQKAMWDLRMAIIMGEAENLKDAQKKLLEKNQYLSDLWERFYVKGVDDLAYHCFLAKAQAQQIFPYEYWDKTSTYENADVNGDRFQEYCKLMGIVPRFSGVNSKGENLGYGDFTKDKGYWKLLIDRSMYTNTYDEDGNWTGYGAYRDQSPINCTNFNVETLDPAWTKATYGDVMTAENDPSKTSSIVRSVVNEIAREVRDGEKVDVMHSGRGGYDYSVSFAQQVDDYLAGNIPKDDTLVVGRPPQALRDVGFANLPMTYATGHIDDILSGQSELRAFLTNTSGNRALGWRAKNHSFELGVLKKMMEAIADPVAIIRSEKYPNTSVVIITTFNYADRPMNAAIEINGYGKENGNIIDSYAITSFYRGDVAADMLAEAIKVEGEGEHVGVYYLNKEIAADILGGTGSTGSGTSELTNGINHKITDPKAEVNPQFTDNTQTTQFRHWFDRAHNILKNPDGNPRVLYGLVSNDTPVRNGVGYALSVTKIPNGTEVYGRLTRPLVINAEAGKLDGQIVARQILANGVFKDAAKRIERSKISPIMSMKNTKTANSELVKYLTQLGIDGIQFRGRNGDSYVVFSPEQIKSTKNIGLFSDYTDSVMHSGRDISGVTQGLNFRDPTGELLDRVFDGSKKYETRRYTVSKGNGKLAGAFLNKPMGIVQTGAGQAQLVGFWELGDGELKGYDWLKEHAAELGNDGTEFEAKPGDKKWVYPIKWAERTDPAPVTSGGQVVRNISDIVADLVEQESAAEEVAEALEDHVFLDPTTGEAVMHSVRENQSNWSPLRNPDGSVKLVYKAFYAMDGKLYPPMISNLSDTEKKKIKNAVSGTLTGLDTPVGVILDAEVGELARYKNDASEYDVMFRKLWKGSSKAIKQIKAELTSEGYNVKTGLTAEAQAAAEAKMEKAFPQLAKASKENLVEHAGELIRNESGRLAVVNSKGGGTLAFRPGWHLGEWPNLHQFDVKDPFTGKDRSAMPDSLVFCACEIAGDIDYQLEAMELGMTASGGFDRTQAGLPYIPEDGYYKYRTNADPTTAPWYITGAIKVVEILDDEDCRRICAEYGVTPQPRVSHQDIDLAKYGLKRGPVTAPSNADLQAYRKSQAAVQNEAALQEALADPAYQDAYLSRAINFEDAEIQKEFARNGQDAEYYRGLYEQKQAGVMRSSRAAQTAAEAAEELDKLMGKGTAKNLQSLVRKYEQQAQNARKQLELEQAQRKLQQKQFRKELADLKKTSAQQQKIQGKALRAVNNELNKARRENQRKVANLEKKIADISADTVWKVGLAQSDGEQKLKAAKRFYEEKVRYNEKTDKQWARGLANSRGRNVRNEERRRAKEMLSLQRTVLSLPGSAAIKARRQFNNRAKKVEMINGGSAVYTPIFRDQADSKLPKTAAEARQKLIDLKGAAYRRMVNDVAELDNMAKLQTRTDDLSTMINVLRASSATPEIFYSVGMVDKQGNLIGPSFEELLLCHDAEGNFDPQLQAALQDYMYHKHNVDRMSLEKRAVERVQAFINNGRQWLLDMTNTELAQLAKEGNPIIQEYVQLMRWAANVKNKAVMADADNYAVDANTSQQLCETYERDMPWLKDKAGEIYKYWDIFMREWAVGTSISLSDYEDMRELYPHYVPTYRVQNGQKARVTRTSNGIVTGEMVKGAKGSTKELLSLEDQFVKSMKNIIQGARLNDVSRNLIEELLFDDEGVFSDFGVFDWESSSQAFRQTFWDFDDQQNEQRIEKLTMDGKEVYRISCWVDGVKMSAYVNRAMFEGMQSLAGYQSDFIRTATKIGRKVTAPMKAMITGYNPTFALKNLLRDQHTALTNSQAGIAYWKYLGRAAALMSQNADEWVNFQALGGVSSNETRVDGGFAKAMHNQNGAKKAYDWTKEKLGALGEASESVSRFAEYLAIIDMLGGDSYENRMAAIRGAAEVTVDFGRGGSWGRMINAWVPYWNANVQGLDKAIRNIAEQPDVKNMIARVGRAWLVNLIPAALQAALLYATKRWKDYEELSDQQKDNYYCFPIIGKEHKFLKIPKSQDWAAFISTPFIRIMEGVNGRDDPFEGWFESAVVPQMPFDTREVLGVENVPVILPIGMDWWLELAENKNWAGSAIVPYNLEDASAKEQFDADTSLLAYYFGQWFKGSPMQLDYIIDDYMGNFWGVVAKTLPISPLVSRGIVTGEAAFKDRATDMLITAVSPFVTDNRASNSTMAAYYDMIDQLEQEVTDAGAHGDKKDAEHYDIYEALNQPGGYIDQIRDLTSEARGMTKGEEQNQVRWDAIGLADLAMEFVQKCLDGEIEDPKLWMTYAPYGNTILNEAEALKKYEDDFNFSGQLGNPAVIYDRSGDTDIRYNLSENVEAQREYSRLRSEEYKKALELVIRSSDYKNASPTEKAALLEEAKRQALKSAEQQMLTYLRREGIKGETVGKADYTTEQRAAAYSVSWLLGADNAYSPKLTDAFVSLYDYNDQYSFVPSESGKRTFKDPGDGSKVYVLDRAQQDQYAKIYHDVITDYYSRIIGSTEYQNAGDELRAAMLSKAKTYANDEIRSQFDAWLKASGATATALDQASAEISLEAKYAVQRALGDDHSMRQDITDELVRLYQYSDVGEVQYFPITTAPKSYVDDRDKDYIWILNDDQREVYMSMMFDIYQRNIRKVMDSSDYKQADDYGKAQLLCDVRSRLSGEVQAEFKHWLRTSGATRTYRNSPEAQAQAADVDAAAAIVNRILGSARTYKQFNESLGY